MRNKRLVIILLSLIFVAVVALSFTALYSVKDVECSYSVYDSSDVGKAQELLQSFKGKNLLFLKEDAVEKAILDNTSLKVESVEKVYPNKIKVKLTSRQERFAILSSSGSYYILDEDFTVVAIRNNISNTADELDNILVDFQVEDKPNLELKQTLDIDNDLRYNALYRCVKPFSSPRDEILSITLYETEEKGNFRVFIKLREGVTIVVYKALTNTDNKILAGLSKYSALDDKDKLQGQIVCYEETSGLIKAVYTNEQ